MQREKSRVHGWFWVILVTFVLSSLVWFVMSKPGIIISQAPAAKRTYAIAGSTSPQRPTVSRIDPVSEIYDPALNPAESTWLDYRSRSVSANLSPTMAPIARVDLMEPTSSSPSMDEWQSNLRSARRDRGLLESASRERFVSSKTQLLSPEDATLSELSKAEPSFASGLQGVWPIPQKLIGQLQKLNETVGAATPREHLVSRRISDLPKDPITIPEGADPQLQALLTSAKDQLNLLTSYGDCRPEALECIKTLDGISDQLLQLASQQSVLEIGEATARTGYSIKRRTKLWSGVFDCLQNSAADQALATQNFSREELAKLIERVVTDAAVTGDVPGWRTYLLLDEWQRIASETSLQDRDFRTARQLLDRVSWTGVTGPQRAFLDSAGVRELALYVQPLAIKPIDYRKLLSDFETLENDSLHRCSTTIVSALQSLRYSDSPSQLALSEAISTYYRNANVRVAISSDMINRFVPETTNANRPVHQNILGANTTGGSNVQTRLNFNLIPNKNAWQVRLQLNADIASKTASEKWPAVIHSASNMQVLSSREITITPEQLNIVESGPASVQSTDRVRDVETSFDGLPIVSDMVRFFVDQKLTEQRPIARRITQNIVKNETNREFDTQLNKQLQGVQDNIKRRVVQPLQFIGIDSDVVDLETTDTRLIGRYRIASYDALAANTPRPQAPGDSLFSMQVHQSAVNNTFQQLKLGGRDWKIPELLEYLSERLSLQLDADPDLPAGVVMRFEDLNPITVEFVDDQMLLALRIARLSEPGRIDLKRFIIRVTYAIDANGLNADLVRNGVISVDGERLGMRDRLPLRAIFGRVFAGHSRVQLVKPEVLSDKRLEGLAVSQVVSREGWMAFAISPAQSPNVAAVQPDLQVVR